MATSWDALLDQVLTKIAGVPLAVGRQAVIRATRDLCRKTLWWQDDLSDIAVVGGTSTYTITEPAETEIVRVLGARLSAANKSLEPGYIKQIESLIPGWRTETGVPDYFMQPTRTQIQLVRTPASADTLQLPEVALMPALGAADLDRDDLYAEHQETIAVGARAMLMDSDGLPYSNPARARMLMSEFDARLTAIALERIRARTSAPAVVAGSDR